jgi:putative toxin-antitoxin system antitoxin component (TIGR02293 family)
MLDDESRSLKALSIALEQFPEPLDKQTQQKINQAVKDLRLAVRACSPLLAFYNEALDRLQDSTESQPRNKLIKLSATYQPDLDKNLDINQKRKLDRITTAHEHAAEVFEDSDIAWDWLQSPNGALEWKIPLQLLETEEGAQQVETVLGRIDYGVYS